MDTNHIIKRYYWFQFVSGLHLIGAVLIPFFTDWGGVTIFVAQALQSWFALWIFVLEVPTGVVADLLGRKHSVALGALVMGIGALVYGSIPNLLVFALGEFLFAAGVALISGADNALLYDTLVAGNRKQEAKAVFGKARSLHMSGIAIGALVGSVVAKIFGLNVPMLLTAVISFIGAGIAYSIPEPPRISDPNEERKFWSTLKRGFVPIRNNAVLRRWTINSTLVATAGYFVIWLYQPMMKEIKIPIEYYGLAQAFLVVAEVLVAANFEKLVRLSGSVSRYVGFSAVVTGLGFAMAAIWPNIFTLMTFLALSGGLGLTRDQLMSAEMNVFIKSDQRATTLSAVSMMQRISQATLNPLIGFLTDKSVFYSLMFVSLLPFLAFLAPVKREDTE